MKPLHLQFDRWTGWRRELVTLFCILTGTCLQALVITGIYSHNRIVTGGVAGIAMLLDYALHIPSFVTVAVLNVPIMILGWRKLNARLALYSILAVALFDAVLALTPDFRVPVENPLIALLFGAVLMGLASAPVVRMGASMGGMDIVSLVLSRSFSFPMGSFNIALNLVIMACLAFVRGLDAALMSMVAMFVANVAFQYFLQGLNRTKTVFIISRRHERIVPQILFRLHRGATCIPARGAYTKADTTILYVMVRTAELNKLRQIVRENDPDALFSILDTREVVGRGFTPMN